MLKLIGFGIMFISWFWMAKGFNFESVFHFIVGFAIAFAKEIFEFLYSKGRLKIDQRKRHTK
jgi:hypothetical protein